jgi:hypothetical protein
MRIKLLLAFALILNGTTIGRANQALTAELNIHELIFSQEDVVEVPTPKAQLPTISLKKALKVAEQYIRKQKINVAPFYMNMARLEAHGEGKGKLYWHFHYSSKLNELGSSMNIYVAMDGKASLHPST